MIETKRLIVRSFREEDADALCRIKTDPQVTIFCPDFLDVDAKREDMHSYIHDFQRIEDTGDTDMRTVMNERAAVTVNTANHIRTDFVSDHPKSRPE